MADLEKSHDAQNFERTLSKESDSHLSDQSRIDAFTPQEQKRIIRRIDTRLVLTLGFMYCVSLMDRTNLGIASVGGMAVGKWSKKHYTLGLFTDLKARSSNSNRLPLQHNHPHLLHLLRFASTTSDSRPA